MAYSTTLDQLKQSNLRICRQGGFGSGATNSPVRDLGRRGRRPRHGVIRSRNPRLRAVVQVCVRLRFLKAGIQICLTELTRGGICALNDIGKRFAGAVRW